MPIALPETERKGRKRQPSLPQSVIHEGKEEVNTQIALKLVSLP